MRCTGYNCDAVLPVNPRRKGTMCRSCNAARIAADPRRNARIAATMKAMMADPAYRAQRQAAAIAGHHDRMQRDPAYRAWQVEQGQRAGRLLPPRVRDLPPPYLREYLALADKKLSADERYRIITEQLERDQAAARAVERRAILGADYDG